MVSSLQEERENFGYILIECTMACFLWSKVFRELGILSCLPKKARDLLFMEAYLIQIGRRLKEFGNALLWQFFGVYGMKEIKECYGRD